jgi:hypothetical protein
MAKKIRNGDEFAGRLPRQHPSTLSAIQDNIHLHTIVITRKRRLLEFRLEQSEEAIGNLASALEQERKRRLSIIAQINGLQTVLSSRNV